MKSFKSIFTALVLLSFIGAAALGLFVMHNGVEDHVNNCAIAASQGSECAGQIGSASYVDFHFGAFRNFTTATFAVSAIVLIALLSIIIAITVLKRLTEEIPIYNYLFHSRKFEENSFRPSLQHKLIRWLARHENSPAF
ncbi:MAG: hypothetical protein HZA95_00100 [Candidatus Vogelbacteria bacterium]|nr:hypothetical protein [Candidatus Vogelbacteria bacterium]